MRFIWVDMQSDALQNRMGVLEGGLSSLKVWPIVMGILLMGRQLSLADLRLTLRQDQRGIS